MKIEQLKHQGHELLDELYHLQKPRIKMEDVYLLLKRRMKGKNPHFGSMRDKAEVMLAVGTLKKMIYERRHKHN